MVTFGAKLRVRHHLRTRVERAWSYDSSDEPMRGPRADRLHRDRIDPIVAWL